jgi:hypothetical protein
LDKIIHAVYTEALIESSSDFIVVTWEYAKKLNEELFLKFDPVYIWEYKNWHDNSSNNIKFIDNKLKDLDLDDYSEVITAYTNVLDYFLENENMSKMYPLNSVDDIGKKIWKELVEKRELARKYYNIELFKRSKNV